VAGFEWGSGFYINPVMPEEAASFLRDAEDEVANRKPAVAAATSA
jgi:galactose-1-phosphate uridylyltransferase